jgi:hypothetical protein
MVVAKTIREMPRGARVASGFNSQFSQIPDRPDRPDRHSLIDGFTHSD